eukprot:1663394-Lingulodinium_polyedra.AAC.1
MPCRPCRRSRCAACRMHSISVTQKAEEDSLSPWNNPSPTKEASHSAGPTCWRRRCGPAAHCW